MKPYRMTPTFQIIKPEPWENELWDAVRTAVDACVGINALVCEVKNAYIQTLYDKAKEAEMEIRP